MIDTFENLKKRIMVLNEKVWEDRMQWPKVEEWLANFTGRVADVDIERLHALFWLSQFMYFGAREIRVLLKAMYRDLFLYPLIQEARISSATRGISLDEAVRDELLHTRFFGVGNPSESGVHLLYYFRQENGLGKKMFMDSVQIFSRPSGAPPVACYMKAFLTKTKLTNPRSLRHPELRRYVFLDDVCGSGDTAVDYSKEIVEELLDLNPDVSVAYYSLFATADGLQKVRDQSLFGQNCGAVYELDDTYRCLSVNSRYLKATPPAIDLELARRIVKEYGKLLDPRYATGWADSQMLIGFHHNTPDNTVGIVWHDSVVGGGRIPWRPAFKRYPKVYGEGV